MSQGQIGVTVSSANPFEDSNSFYNEENYDSNVSNNSYSSNNYNSSYDYNDQTSTTNDDNTKKKSNFMQKTKKGVSNVLQMTSDKIGKPVIRVSQNINTKFCKFFKL